MSSSEEDSAAMSVQALGAVLSHLPSSSSRLRLLDFASGSAIFCRVEKELVVLLEADKLFDDAEIRLRKHGESAQLSPLDLL